MSRVYVASDLHLGQENMAKHRGFETVEEHVEYIIKKWNSVVGKRDTVYVLGDITMENSLHYHKLSRLNGLIRVVGGNHDMPKDCTKLLNYVESISGMISYKGWVLTHCPIHPKELYRFKGNIQGHVHSNSLKDGRYINVSMEAINYTPVLISNLKVKKISWFKKLIEKLLLCL
jgi:calcineurin-like phosphoesterase family protein